MSESLELLQLRAENQRLRAQLQKAYKHRAEIHARLLSLTSKVCRGCGKPLPPPEPLTKTNTPGH